MAEVDHPDDTDGVGGPAASDPGTVRVPLRDGRTLAVTDGDEGELVEVRGGDGGIQLRILLTDKGPVLQMDAVRLELKADGAVELDAKSFTVKTEDGVQLEAGGGIGFESGGDVRVDAAGDVRIVGSMIYLN